MLLLSENQLEGLNEKSSKISHFTMGLMIEYAYITHEGKTILTIGKCIIIYKVRINVKYHLMLPEKKTLTKTHAQNKN